MNIDDATVEMGALGTNQIPYLELTQRQKVVRDLSVKRMRERERAERQGQGMGPRAEREEGKGCTREGEAREWGRPTAICLCLSCEHPALDNADAAGANDLEMSTVVYF